MNKSLSTVALSLALVGMVYTVSGFDLGANACLAVANLIMFGLHAKRVVKAVKEGA